MQIKNNIRWGFFLHFKCFFFKPKNNRNKWEYTTKWHNQFGIRKINKSSESGISQRRRLTSLGNTSCDVSVHSLVTASPSLLGISFSLLVRFWITNSVWSPRWLTAHFSLEIMYDYSHTHTQRQACKFGTTVLFQRDLPHSTFMK